MVTVSQLTGEFGTAALPCRTGPRELGRALDWAGCGLRRCGHRVEGGSAQVRRKIQSTITGGLGQRFQCPRTASPLNSMTLNFPDDRRRDMRALGKFTLAPSKLSHPIINRFGDRRPVLRHHSSEIRLGADISPCSSFRTTTRRLLRAHGAKRRLVRAEISEI